MQTSSRIILLILAVVFVVSCSLTSLKNARTSTLNRNSALSEVVAGE